MEKDICISKNICNLCKKILGIKNQKDFLIELGFDRGTVDKVNPHDLSKIFKTDYYDFLLTKKDFNLEHFKKRIEETENDDINYQSINDFLVEIVDSLGYYLNENKRTNKQDDANFLQYDSDDKERLKIYFELKSPKKNLSYNLYLLMYLAIYKHLPNDFTCHHYDEDLEEFNKKVIRMYGATSNPAVRAIISLAEREQPNIIALYELADMYYYGNAQGIKTDIVKAYELYERAAGVDVLSHTSDASKCHPLALWTLSYILLNYHRKGTDLEKCREIPSIEDLNHRNPLLRIELSIKYAMASMAFIKNGPSANILGKIALLSEDEFSGISKIRKKYDMKPAGDYFNFAAENGYIYAINNQALAEAEEIFKNPNDKKIHLEKYTEFLKKSAKQYEPWAANTLAEFYRTGTIERRDHILGSKTGEVIKFKEKINMDKAFEYYNYAIKYFQDSNSAWAYVNLLNYYPEMFRGQTDIIKDYISKIKGLNNASALEKAYTCIYKNYRISKKDI